MRRCSTKVKPGVELMKSRFKDYDNKTSLSNLQPIENPTWLKRGAKDRAAMGVICYTHAPRPLLSLMHTEPRLSLLYFPVWQLITVGVGVVVTAFMVQVRTIFRYL